MATLKSAIQLYDGMSPALHSMNKALNIVLNSFESLQSASDKSIDTSSIQAAREELAKAAISFDQVEKEIEQANRAQKNLNESIRSGSGSADFFKSKLLGLGAIIGGMAGLGKGLEISDQLANTQARLNLLVDDNGSVKELEQKIMASAQRSGSYYMDTAAAVTKLGLNAGAAFDHNNDQIIAFMEQVNKQFAIGGATAQEQSNAMTQLTQAMAAGALRGEELNSILDGAPGIARAIEQYMGIAEGSIKSVAEQGLVTAEVVKNAMFNMAEETNAAFDSMPLTWETAWIRMKNSALSVFSPILQKLNQLANSEKFAQLTDSLINGLSGVARIAMAAFDLLLQIAYVIMDNWSWLAPLVYGVAAALAVYYGWQVAANTAGLIAKGIHLAMAAAQMAHAAVTGTLSKATASAIAAQRGLNAALYACPLVWIIALIIGAIALFYLAIKAINKFAGASLSATGIIGGAFALAGAFILNTFVIPLQNYFAALVNFFGNVFNDPIAAIKVLFFDMCLTVLGYLKNLASAIETLLNKIPGVEINITGGLDGFYTKLEQAQKTVKDESGWKEYVKKRDFIDYKDAAKAGYNLGQKLENKLGEVFNSSKMDNMGASTYGIGDNLPKIDASLNELYNNTSLDDLYTNTSEIAENTAKMADSLEMTEEDLKFLRQIAERETINQFTTAEIKIEMNNQNTISGTLDLDGIIEALEVKVEEAMFAASEGAHI